MIFELFKKKESSIKNAKIDFEIIDDNYDDNTERIIAVDNLVKKYNFELHDSLRLGQEIKQKYSVAINQNNIFNKFTDECEKLCIKCIKYAPAMLEYQKQYDKLYERKNDMYSFSAFTYLTKIYERKQEYDKAIFTCIDALKMGYRNDSESRIARMIKKYNKQNNTNISFDYDKNILLDENNNEIIL